MGSSSYFRPNEIAPRSGVYRVRHYAHRLPHTLMVLAGTRLPECKRCGSKVRFIPMVPADPIEKDHDFGHAGIDSRDDAIKVEIK
jgi:hypothetical protein